jgi:CO dehydrogenase maturation factor
LLGQIEDDGTVVLADFEAGLGTLSRMRPGQLDLALVVAEPSAKAIEVARRAVDLLREREVSRTVIIGNRVGGPPDQFLISSAFADAGVTLVPDDPAIRTADAQGLAAFDSAPTSPAVRALRALAASLAS